MRILVLLAVVAFAIALVANLVPTSPIGVNDLGWTILGLLLLAIDRLLGGYTVAAPARRAAP